MPLNRFYLQDPLLLHETVSLQDKELHHMVHVMRHREGEEIELINGKGVLAQAKILELNKKQALLKIQAIHKEPSTPPQILLGIPLLRPAKLEWIVEKATELGIDLFYFYPSDLGEKKSFSAHQLERIHSLLIAAVKQSGRLFLPQIEFLPHFSSFFQKNIPIYYGDTSLQASALRKVSFPCIFITGPEPGFSDEEHFELKQKGQAVSLSKQILRAETAPLAAASILSWQRQDLLHKQDLY